jgi:hypothetical protein
MSTQNLRWEIPLQNSGGPNLLLAGDAPSVLSPLLLVFSACKVSKKSPRNDNMQTGERFFLNQRKDNGKKFSPTGRGSSIVSPIDNRQPSFCRPAPLQRILDIYLSEQENPDGLFKFKDRTRLNKRLNSSAARQREKGTEHDLVFNLHAGTRPTNRW